MKKIFLAKLFLFSFASLFAQQHFISMPLGSSYNELLEKVFDGKYDTATQSIKWKASAADLYEFGGTLGDGFLCTKLDTAFKYENNLYLITQTSSYMKNDEGEGRAPTAAMCAAHISA